MKDEILKQFLFLGDYIKLNEPQFVETVEYFMLFRKTFGLQRFDTVRYLPVSR